MIEKTPQPYPSWVWIDVTYQHDNGEIEIVAGYWDSPKPLPLAHGKVFVWNEEKQDWLEAK